MSLATPHYCLSRRHCRLISPHYRRRQYLDIDAAILLLDAAIIFADDTLSAPLRYAEYYFFRLFLSHCRCFHTLLPPPLMTLIG